MAHRMPVKLLAGAYTRTSRGQARATSGPRQLLRATAVSFQWATGAAAGPVQQCYAKLNKARRTRAGVERPLLGLAMCMHSVCVHRPGPVCEAPV